MHPVITATMEYPPLITSLVRFIHRYILIFNTSVHNHNITQCHLRQFDPEAFQQIVLRRVGT